MKHLGKIETLGEREIWYSKNMNDFSNTELENWLFLPIVENLERDELDEIAKWCLDKKAIYACCLGNQCEILHDYIDENYAYRELKYIKGEIPKEIILTTWHFDFEEGFRFATNAANHPDALIKNIVCLDFSDKNKEDKLKELIQKTKNGWFPNE